ncbi:MAG: LOG family protein, partial [Bacteroidales bacterium]|nr:LOG family protein [Bacteroidales bacterium]
MERPADLIKEAFDQKTWNEIHITDSWRVFKILSELVEGFEKLARIGPCVSIFGSARTKPDNRYYQLAEDIAFKLTLNVYGVITGGGPGIMEAANKGAFRGKGKSVGINIDLPFEQHANPYIDPDKLITFDHFFVKKIQGLPGLFQPLFDIGKGLGDHKHAEDQQFDNFNVLLAEIML